MTCPVCEGAGYWDRLTGHPVHTKPLREGLQRCPYCEGRGTVPRWETPQVY
jgi:DnaJ-class molecular chaperone